MYSKTRPRSARGISAWAVRTLSGLSTVGLLALGLFAPGTAFAATSGEVIAVAPTDTPATIIANAANVVPSSRQPAWERLEETAFLHFGVNTYDGREWGTGTEDPNIFQPSGLNTDQWASSLIDELWWDNANGTLVQLWARNGQSNQQWSHV